MFLTGRLFVVWMCEVTSLENIMERQRVEYANKGGPSIDGYTVSQSLRTQSESGARSSDNIERMRSLSSIIRVFKHPTLEISLLLCPVLMSAHNAFDI